MDDHDRLGSRPQRHDSIDYGDAMMQGLFLQTIVVDTSLFEVSIDRSDAPRAMSVELTRNGMRVRGWEEPGWRDLGIGVSRGRFYWWSARRLVVVGVEGQVVLEMETDEDILVVFASRRAGYSPVSPRSWFWRRRRAPIEPRAGRHDRGLHVRPDRSFTPGCRTGRNALLR